jgi:signal recognition particle receptor subunit beta
MASAGLRRANPLRLLICAHKADLLRVGDKTVIMPAATAVAAQDRVRSILTREMDRLKGARGRAGGRIEGMARVASGRGGWFSRLFGGSNTPAPTAEDEDDDAAVWGGAGGFRWDDVDGVDVAWGASALGPAGGEADVEEHDGGLDELTEFMAGL